jgi:hypothetical protein
MEQNLPRGSLLGILWRHRVVVAVGLALVVGLLIVTAVTTPPVYRATSSMVLLNPPSPPADKVKDADPTIQNPIAAYNDLSIVTDILQRIVTSDAVGQDLIHRGLVGTFTVTTNGDFSRGPVIILTAEGPTRAAPLNTLTMLQDEINKQLVALQTGHGTDPTFFISSQTVVNASRSTVVFSATLRRLIEFGALGVLAVLASAGAAELISSRRRGDGDPDAEAMPREERDHLRLA